MMNPNILSLPKSTAICTLFEGHYHYGVAVLTNSLYANGFRGDIYAGYRGALPSWTDVATDNSMVLGKDGKTMAVADGINLHLVPVTTDYHLTNYKPDFMMRLWNGPAHWVDKLFYFDPDIVVSAPWKYFITWTDYGVALCEDVNSPLPKNHPRRVAWRNYFRDRGIELHFKDPVYVNGGYIGIDRKNESFLQTWITIQEAMASVIGGLSRSALAGKALPEESQGPFSAFGKTDQDALNAAIEAWNGEFSFVGQEGMSLRPGAALMPHALGQPKPWKWNPVAQAFSGRPPRTVDREYWKNASGIITAHSNREVKGKLIELKIASLIGRFYKRR